MERADQCIDQIFWFKFSVNNRKKSLAFFPPILFARHWRFVGIGAEQREKEREKKNCEWSPWSGSLECRSLNGSGRLWRGARFCSAFAGINLNFRFEAILRPSNVIENWMSSDGLRCPFGFLEGARRCSLGCFGSSSTLCRLRHPQSYWTSLAEILSVREPRSSWDHPIWPWGHLMASHEIHRMRLRAMWNSIFQILWFEIWKMENRKKGRYNCTDTSLRAVRHRPVV